MMNLKARLVDAGLLAPAKFFESYGVVRIKGFLSKSEAAELLNLVNACYVEVGKAIEDGDATALDETFRSQYSVYNAIWSPPLTEILKARRPDLYATWEVVAANIHNAQARIFQDRWAICPKRVYFRRHKTEKKYLPWHIDGDAAGMWNFGKDTINVWLPLQDVGNGRAPSLDFVPKSHVAMKKLPLLRNNEAIRDDGWVSENVSAERWTPRAGLGDALIFSHWTLHRTQTQKTVAPERASCEFRFVPTREDEKEIVLPEYLREPAA